MRTIERRFNKIKKENTHLADYSCLVEAVSGQRFTRRSIYEYFVKLIDSEDYDTKDTNLLVRHLYNISKQAEECTFLSKIAPEASEITKHEHSVTLPSLHSPFTRKRPDFVID